jgi:hypothetical protein
VFPARDQRIAGGRARSRGGLQQGQLRIRYYTARPRQNNHWPDGKSVTFIMRNPSAPEMKVLLEKIYELPESQVKDLITTANHGRAGHPAVMVVDSDEDLVNKVASIPGAIGVVDVYAINSSVAVVKVAGKLPLEPGYPLHGN